MSKKKKNITFLFLLDASSSMLEDNKHLEVKDGIKNELKDIRKKIKKNEANITTIVAQFSYHTRFEVLVNSVNDTQALKGITRKYKPNGMTALRDSIKKAFDLIPQKQDGVFVNVFTDGKENDSKNMSISDIKELLTTAHKNKWGLTFSGASEQDILAAQNLGFAASNMVKVTNTRAGMKSANMKRARAKNVYYSSVMESTNVEDIKNTDLFTDQGDGQ